MCSLRVELGKNCVRVDQTLDGSLEQHKYHHNTENLQTVAGKVHHQSVHRQLFRRCQGDFPGLLDLQRIGFDGLLRRGCGLLFLLLQLLLLVTSLESIHQL